jgi:hypothetical protein
MPTTPYAHVVAAADGCPAAASRSPIRAASASAIWRSVADTRSARPDLPVRA